MSFLDLFRSSASPQADDPTVIVLSRNAKTLELLQMHSARLNRQLSNLAAGVRSPVDVYTASIMRELLANGRVDGQVMLDAEKANTPDMDEEQFWSAFDFVKRNNAK